MRSLVILFSLLFYPCQVVAEPALLAPVTSAGMQSNEPHLEVPPVYPSEGWQELFSRGAIMMLSAQNNDQAIAGALILLRVGEYYNKEKPETKLPDLSPTGKKLLTQNGISTIDFRTKLLRGEFTNHEEVLAGAGITHDLEDDEVDRGVALADAELRATFGDWPPQTPTKPSKIIVAPVPNRMVSEKIQTILKVNAPNDNHKREFGSARLSYSNLFRTASRHFRAWQRYARAKERSGIE